MWKRCFDKDQKIKWPFWLFAMGISLWFPECDFRSFCVPNTMSPHWIPESATVGTVKLTLPRSFSRVRPIASEWIHQNPKASKHLPNETSCFFLRFVLLWSFWKKQKESFQFHYVFFWNSYVLDVWSNSVPTPPRRPKPLHSSHLRCWRSQCWEHQNFRFFMWEWQLFGVSET